MILYQMEELKKNNKDLMPFAMLLTRLYNYILLINPQAIVPLNRFTFHERVTNPLDISRIPIKEKGKRIASTSASSSSSSSSDGNEAPSFLEVYEERSNNDNLIDTQREKRGMFKCLNCYFGTITNCKNAVLVKSIDVTDPAYGRFVCGLGRYVHHQARMSVKHSNFINLDSLSEEHQNKKTSSPPPRKKSLSPPQAPSKPISSKGTHYTSSSSPKLPPLASSPNNLYVSNTGTWPPVPSNPSPPPRVTRPPPRFLHPLLGFEQLTTTQPLFVNIDNNTPHIHNNAPPLENI
ncbi:hypothetical protein Tco_1095048 [Tanacetum coccineum]